MLFAHGTVTNCLCSSNRFSSESVHFICIGTICVIFSLSFPMARYTIMLEVSGFLPALTMSRICPRRLWAFFPFSILRFFSGGRFCLTGGPCMDVSRKLQSPLPLSSMTDSHVTWKETGCGFPELPHLFSRRNLLHLQTGHLQ